jgi:hypothetical protein
MVAKSVLAAPKRTPLRLIIVMRTCATFPHFYVSASRRKSQQHESATLKTAISQPLSSAHKMHRCTSAAFFRASNHFIVRRKQREVTAMAAD